MSFTSQLDNLYFISSRIATILLSLRPQLTKQSLLLLYKYGIQGHYDLHLSFLLDKKLS